MSRPDVDDPRWAWKEYADELQAELEEKTLLWKFEFACKERLQAENEALRKERAGQVLFEVCAAANEKNIAAKIEELGWLPPDKVQALQAELGGKT